VNLTTYPALARGVRLTPGASPGNENGATGMQEFSHADVKRFQDVRRLVGPRDMLIAGGTDLVPLMRDGLAAPRTVVDLKPVRGGAALRAASTGATIGALALVADVAADTRMKRWFPALADACLVVGSAQIRNLATIGGNLCQRIRCWYFRQRVPCHKTGAAGCPAVAGLNEQLAVFGTGPCHAPHPSDPAVALAALNARVYVRRRSGRTARLSIAELYATAATRRDAETVLGAGEVIEKIAVPAAFAGARQVYIKTAQREMFDFALVSVCVVRPKRRGSAPRIVLGGVAPRPWEVAVRDGGSGAAWVERLADAAVRGAAPLSQNAYKIEIARNLIREALLRT